MKSRKRIRSKTRRGVQTRRGTKKRGIKTRRGTKKRGGARDIVDLTRSPPSPEIVDVASSTSSESFPLRSVLRDSDYDLSTDVEPDPEPPIHLRSVLRDSDYDSSTDVEPDPPRPEPEPDRRPPKGPARPRDWIDLKSILTDKDYEDDDDSVGESSDSDLSEPVPPAIPFQNPCRYMNHPLSAAESKERRDRVTQGYRHSHTLDGLNVTQLRDLFDLYDLHFFDNAFNRYLVPPNKFEVKFTTHAVTTAGFCKRTGCEYYISINKSIFTDKLFTGAAQHFHAANGLVCRTKLDCLQLVMEHEMIHLLQFIWHQCANTKQSAHGVEFKQLAKNIFGHTETKHELFRELTAEQAEGYTYRKLTRYDDHKKRLQDDLRVGDIIEVDKIPGQFRVDKLPLNKREVNIKATKLSDNSKWRLKVSIGYKIVRRDAASSSLPASSAQNSKERMVGIMNRLGKVTVSVTYRGVVHTGDVIKMNPKKFVIQMGTQQIQVPYEYHEYRIV